MTSDRKIRANRANARLSRGTKTSHGRARSARNAYRHGLSLPVHFDPALSEEVKVLANQIAGPSASAELQERARRIAEAEIDLRRVRRARHKLLSDALNNPGYDPRKNERKKLAALLDQLRSSGPYMPIIVQKLLPTPPQGPFKFAVILAEEATRLLAMNRYERRALSRRKFAVREFDAVRRDANRV